MRKVLKNLGGLLIAVSAITILTSAAFVRKAPPVNKTKVDAAVLALKKASADGKLTTKELTKIATDLKGSKLSLKEKLMIKIFGKNIASKIDATTAPYSEDGKSQVIALILCIVVGGLGIHRFYLGYTWQGIVQLLTAGACGIWTLIDLIRIITGDLKPKNGEYGKTL